MPASFYEFFKVNLIGCRLCNEIVWCARFWLNWLQFLILDLSVVCPWKEITLPPRARQHTRSIHESHDIKLTRSLININLRHFIVSSLDRIGVRLGCALNNAWIMNCIVCFIISNIRIWLDRVESSSHFDLKMRSFIHTFLWLFGVYFSVNYFPSLGSLIKYIGHACTGDVLVAVIDLMRSIVSIVSMLIYVDKWLRLLNLLVIDLDLESILRLHQRTLSGIIFAVIVCFCFSSRSGKAYHAKNGALSIILNLVVHLVVR